MLIGFKCYCCTNLSSLPFIALGFGSLISGGKFTLEIYFQNLLTGLGDGAVIAGIALGLVLAYQGSGVLNFAHGAMMMYSTYIYDELRDTGDFVFPISFFGTDRVNLLGTPEKGELAAFWPSFQACKRTEREVRLQASLNRADESRRLPMPKASGHSHGQGQRALGETESMEIR